LQSGDLDAATETFEALLKRDPGDALTWFNLGQTAQAAGDPETAASHFQRAVNLAPGDPRFQQALNTARKQLPPLQGPR
jgi:Tfp pilus assembly protein PilF